MIDNFNRDNISDVLIAENVPESHAELIANLLNERLVTGQSPDFYVAYGDDYKLYKFIP